VTTQRPSILLDASQIAKLIPHHGSMCLLDRVMHCDAQTIHCGATSHRSLTNPLREQGILHAVCGIEYAAQAMAVHGALLSERGDKPPRSGRLASVRSVALSATRLDDVAGDLDVCATQLMGDDSSMVYEFIVATAGQTLLKGKATVVLVS
jgi:predicted hotdog family 3-hydroxylacyl-ACP dehydratase